MTIRRMDNVLIVVDDLEAATAFFAELGMEPRARRSSREIGLTAPSDSRASVPTSSCCGPRTATGGSS